MAHFNSPAFDPGFGTPAPLRISARLREFGTWLQIHSQTLLRWYQGQILMADLNERLLRDGGLERDHSGTSRTIARRLPETGHFLARHPRG
ncbi:hypothetical protein [Thalassospira mesophila]|uniref:Uncharacterized protein n=1 Tax=Thalassospira mesophila TaxID=1293891 RepID=A0A1Y2KWN7_9PROT|nr:hypothetical protein [Thalassospira mesophila]OSQ36088.1 hypothetical protein TMES_18560 [Thalassospira mesophila]